MDDLLTLIAETYAQDDIGQQIATETATNVWAHLRSVSRAEWFAAGRDGMQPELVAETPIVNYNGERIAVWRGKRYNVYRTYFADGSDTIELYLEERVGV